MLKYNHLFKKKLLYNKDKNGNRIAFGYITSLNTNLK